MLKGPVWKDDKENNTYANASVYDEIHGYLANDVKDEQVGQETQTPNFSFGTFSSEAFFACSAIMGGPVDNKK